MLIIALLGPMVLMYYSTGWNTQIQMVGALWTLLVNFEHFGYDYGPPYNFNFSPSWFLASLPYAFVRYIFVYMMYRFYTGKATRRRTIMTGIVSELPLPVLFLITMIPMLLFSPPGMGFYFPIFIPVPILFVVGYAIIRFRPPPEEEVWIDREAATQWWDASKQDDETQPEFQAPPQQIEKEAEDDWLVDDRK